jgi:hypothetical protein
VPKPLNDRGRRRHVVSGHPHDSPLAHGMDMHELYASGCRKLQDAALQIGRLVVCQ